MKGQMDARRNEVHRKDKIVLSTNHKKWWLLETMISVISVVCEDGKWDSFMDIEDVSLQTAMSIWTGNQANTKWWLYSF